MPATTKDINFRINGDPTSFTGAMETSEQKFQRFVKMVKDEGIADTKVSRALKFAGATAGAYAFQKVAQEASKVATEIRTGATAYEAFGSIVNKIPIVGQFKQAGEAIRELVTGEQAAIVESNKLNDQLYKRAEIYRAIAQERRTLGKYGDELQKIQVQQGGDNKLAALAEEKRQKQKELASLDFRRVQGGGGMTAAMREERKRLVQDITDIDAQSTEAKRATKQGQLDVQRNINQRELELARSHFEQLEEFRAKAEEKALRRQGRGIESAEVAIREGAASRQRANLAELDDFKQAGMDPKLVAKHAEDIAKLNVQIEIDKNNTIEQLEYEDDRKRMETRRATQEEFTKIQNEANIARLRMQGRDLEAEQAQLREAYRESLVELDKKNREEARAKYTNLFDPDLIAAKNNQGSKLSYQLEEARNKDATASAEKRLTIEQELSKLKLENLRDRASTGTYAEEMAVKQAEIQEKYTEKLQVIHKLEMDRNTTLAQRLRLLGLAEGAKSNRDAELKKLGQPTSLNTPTQFDLTDAGYRTVFGQKGDNKGRDAQLDALNKVVVNTDPKTLGDILTDAVKAGLSNLGIWGGPPSEPQ